MSKKKRPSLDPFYAPPLKSIYEITASRLTCPGLYMSLIM